MTTFRGNVSALMAPGLKKVFMERYKDIPKMSEMIFNRETSDRQFEVSVSLTGLGLVPSKPEGKATQYDDPVQGFNKTFVHTAYSLGYQVTEEAQQDDQYAKLGSKMSNALGRSAAVTREMLAAGIINNGFGDVGPDGVSLFNASHPLVAAGSYGNRPTTPVALSQTTLQAALTSFRQTPDDRGMLVLVRPKYLVVPPALEFYARELVGSALKPDSTYNNVNAIQNSLDVVVWEYLTSNTAWFLFSEKEDHSVVWYDRQPIKFQNSDDFDTGNAKYKVTWRSSCGYYDWRGVYGAPGS